MALLTGQTILISVEEPVTLSPVFLRSEKRDGCREYLLGLTSDCLKASVAQ